jgi:hypothetical protein
MLDPPARSIACAKEIVQSRCDLEQLGIGARKPDHLKSQGQPLSRQQG